ncbi:hydrolase [Bacillaceae bacterium Marseille-Q3522]|nr:hydrolase [Bacillaceae bacterium Marseille-Q3522]
MTKKAGQGMKRTYYISLASGEISTSGTDSDWNMKIEATDEEIKQLRQLFEDNLQAEMGSFVRAHVPYIQYHYDRENDAYDKGMKNIYRLLYELGDEETKRHIESIGILS